MLLELVPEDAPILKQKADAFDFSNPPTDPAELVKNLFDTMFSESAVGLAAPQVGLLHRVFVMYDPGPIKIERAVFNPEVVAVSDELLREREGCLSFPDLWLDVKRPSWVEARYQDVDGNVVNERFENLAARCYLHETDHLNGIRFIELVGPVSLMRAKDRRSKLYKKVSK